MFSFVPSFDIMGGSRFAILASYSFGMGREEALRVLGIDPGIAIVGFGFIDKIGSRLVPVQYGCIKTEAGNAAGRAAEAGVRVRVRADGQIQAGYGGGGEAVLQPQRHDGASRSGKPGASSYWPRCSAGLPSAEYTPMQVKQAVVGYGKAEKRQVQEMVRMFLNLSAIPKPDDVADALAVAICHAPFVGHAERTK